MHDDNKLIVQVIVLTGILWAGAAILAFFVIPNPEKKAKKNDTVKQNTLSDRGVNAQNQAIADVRSIVLKESSMSQSQINAIRNYG